MLPDDHARLLRGPARLGLSLGAGILEPVYSYLSLTEESEYTTTPEQYAEMLSRARAGGYAYPAVNVTSSSTLNAAMRGFAEAGSDGPGRISRPAGAR